MKEAAVRRIWGRLKAVGLLAAAAVALVFVMSSAEARTIATILFAALVWGSSASAAALTIAVNSSADAADPTPGDLTCDTALAEPGMGACTLRAAVETIDGQPPGSGPYTIDVPAGHYILSIDRLELSRDVTIAGSSAKGTVIDGGGTKNPIFVSEAALAIAISGVTITGGNDFARGGGIYNYGNLTLSNSVISGNVASDQGGGIYNNGGHVTVLNSTISGNRAGNGAGINSGALGGAPAGTLTVINSTISGNVADSTGGGVRDTNDLGSTLTSDTVAGNSAGGTGGGLYTAPDGASVTVRNSIIATNQAAGSPNDCRAEGGAIISLGFNLDATNQCGFSATGDQINKNPLLGPLQDNGGATPTMAPASNSPALDQGSAFGLITDERGVIRPIDFASIPNASAPGADGSDIGAFELQPSNAFTLGKLKRNPKNGTASLGVNLPQPSAGTLNLSGKGLKAQTTTVSGQGLVALKVAGRGAVAKALRRHGKHTVTINVTYTPSGNGALTQSRSTKLVLKHKKHRKHR